MLNSHLVIEYIERYATIFKAIVVALIGFMIVVIVSRFVSKRISHRLQPHIRVLFNKFIWYGGLGLLTFVVLGQLHINISALVGAAGVIGVAVGFASQASISNIISGIFLVVEQPFKIGDIIEIDGMCGKVETVDLLAVQLKTSDGRFVRVPNESLIKSLFVNTTFYKMRKITLSGVVRRNEDIQKVIAITLAALQGLAIVKKDVDSSVMFTNVSGLSIELSIQCWVDARNITDTKAMIIKCLYEVYMAHNLDVLIEANQFQQSLLEAIELRNK